MPYLIFAEMRHSPRSFRDRAQHRPSSRPAVPKKSAAVAAFVALVGVYGFVNDLFDASGDVQEVMPVITAVVDAQNALSRVLAYAPVDGFQRTLNSDPTIATGEGYWPEGRVNVQLSYASPEKTLHVAFVSDEAILKEFDVDYKKPPAESLEDIFREQLNGVGLDALATL